MSTFSILPPSPDQPERVHLAHRAAKLASQREEEANAEIAALSLTLRASDPRIRRAQMAADYAENETNDAVVEYLNALRDASRRAHTTAA